MHTYVPGFGSRCPPWIVMSSTDIHYVLDRYFKMIAYSKCLPHILFLQLHTLFVLNIRQKSTTYLKSPPRLVGRPNSILLTNYHTT